jgi:predicted transcriptional regulator
MATINVCMREEQIQALKALAVAMDISASAVVRGAMDDYIKKQRAERASQRRRGRVGEHAWGVFELVSEGSRRGEPNRYTL